MWHGCASSVKGFLGFDWAGGGGAALEALPRSMPVVSDPYVALIPVTMRMASVVSSASPRIDASFWLVPFVHSLGKRAPNSDSVASDSVSLHK